MILLFSISLPIHGATNIHDVTLQIPIPYDINILQDKCPADILNIIKLYVAISQELQKVPNNTNLQELAQKYNKKYTDAVENSARERLGFKKIGESWTNETMLYYIIKGLLPNLEVIFHYRPKWLDGLELDIYIPVKNLAFEYQGIQHFHPVEHWGGEIQLQRQRENDQKKYKLCKEHGVQLLYVNYDEEITVENIKSKLLGFI